MRFILIFKHFCIKILTFKLLLLAFLQNSDFEISNGLTIKPSRCQSATTREKSHSGNPRNLSSHTFQNRKQKTYNRQQKTKTEKRKVPIGKSKTSKSHTFSGSNQNSLKMGGQIHKYVGKSKPEHGNKDVWGRWCLKSELCYWVLVSQDWLLLSDSLVLQQSCHCGMDLTT